MYFFSCLFLVLFNYKKTSCGKMTNIPTALSLFLEYEKNKIKSGGTSNILRCFSCSRDDMTILRFFVVEFSFKLFFIIL